MLRLMLTIKAVICAMFGLLFLIIPAETLNLYAIELGDGGLFISRLLGAAFIVLGVLLWFAVADRGSRALWAIVTGVTIGDTIGFAVVLWAQLNGYANAWGWTTVAIYGLLALGFSYCLFRAPEVSPRPAT